MALPIPDQRTLAKVRSISTSITNNELNEQIQDLIQRVRDEAEKCGLRQGGTTNIYLTDAEKSEATLYWLVANYTEPEGTVVFAVPDGDA